MLKEKNKNNMNLINTDFLINPFNDGFPEDILKSSIVQGKDKYRIIVNINNIDEKDIDIKVENNNLIVTVTNDNNNILNKRTKNFYVGNVKLKEIKQEYSDGNIIFEVPIK